MITTLNALDKGQLVRILTEPKNALVKQYQKLLEYDMVELDFDTQALEAAADPGPSSAASAPAACGPCWRR